VRRSAALTNSTEETLYGLKSELERCLINYRNKRQQVTSLGTELKLIKAQLSDVTSRCESAERSDKENKVSLHVNVVI